MPGQQNKSRTQPGRILMPGQMQQPQNPNSQTGSGKFASIGQELAGSVSAPPRNFRPPTGLLPLQLAPEPDTACVLVFVNAHVSGSVYRLAVPSIVFFVPTHSAHLHRSLQAL